jgi:bla regulator protein blaR1
MVAAATAGAGASWLARALAPFASVSALLPLVVIVWMTGVALLTLRLLRGWLAVRALAERRTVPMRDAWRERLHLLALRIGVGRGLRLRESPAIDIPAVVGWLRPVIIVPTSAFAGLTPSQLDAILAHEIAHVRRHDYLVNLAQSTAETLLFYHPGVWWLSGRIRVEREHCCDDVAVAVCGDRVSYAEALASLEELRLPAPSFALAASGGDLIGRVRRLLDAPERPSERTPAWALVGLVVSLFIVPAASHRAQAAGVAASQAGPEAVRVGGDVKEPKKIHNVAPVYPAEARAAGVQGIVFIEATIDTDGNVSDAKILRGAAPALDQAALDAVGQWQYTPTMLNGVPTPVMMTVTVNFMLSQSAGGQHAGRMSTAAQAARLRIPADTLWVRDGITEPTKIVNVPPVYPADARAQGVQGVVILQVVIDPQGNIADAAIVQSVPLLDQAALDAVKQWKYKPTTLNGEPKPVALTVTVNFTLQ